MANEDGMYDNAYNVLRVRFPKNQGWDIFHKDRWNGYEPDFVIERRNSRGDFERGVAEVKDTDMVEQDHIDQLNVYVRNLSGGNVKIVGKFLIVPAGCDRSIVKADIEVIFLRG
jgi:hypothetical protein